MDHTRIENVEELVNQARVPEALALLQQKISERPYDAALRGSRAQLIVRYGSPTAALSAAADFLAKYPQSPNAPVYLGHAYVRLGRVEEALQEFDRAESMGVCADLMNSYRAWASNRQWLSRHSDSPGALDGASLTVADEDEMDTLMAAGRFAEAQVAWDQRAKDRPDDRFIARGRAWFRVQHLIERASLDSAKEYAARYPDADDAELILAEAYHRGGMPNYALELLQKAEARVGKSGWTGAKRIEIEAELGIESESREGDFARVDEPERVIWRRLIAHPPKSEAALLAAMGGLEVLGYDQSQMPTREVSTKNLSCSKWRIGNGRAAGGRNPSPVWKRHMHSTPPASAYRSLWDAVLSD